MESTVELLRRGKRSEIWERYCGFLDLSIEAFMAIQRRLLSEQLVRLEKCELGRRIIGEKFPRTVEEFRERVPFTSYEQYSEFLLEKNESVLPEKPCVWVHTSGRSSEYNYKWIPYTRKMYELGGESSLAVLLLGSSGGRGDFWLKEGFTFPYIIAPPPYVSGVFTESTIEQFPFKMIPSIEEAKVMDFQKRVEAAFRLALREGLDFFLGVSSILLRVSDQFSMRDPVSKGAMKMPRDARSLFRLLKALLKSKLAGRPLLPRDIWKVKAIICGGMDTYLFKHKVEKSWGRTPLESYASTEFGVVATQVWTCSGMTFFPSGNFWEFISEPEYRKMQTSPGYQPRSFLLDEVKAGEEYVLVGTNLHGGALVRYIIGDAVKIVALEDKSAGVRLPQMVFAARVDDIIDISGFTRLTEKTIWQAIENSGLAYTDWIVRKEQNLSTPILNLYIEFKGQPADMDVIGAAEKIHKCIQELDAPYRDLETMLGQRPLKITRLSGGTFQRYTEERQAAGADLAHLKPQHINPTQKVVDLLLRMSKWSL
jgi:hypothetical protein